MNIGIFTDTYKPQLNGVVTVVKTLERELKNKGHNVYIFTVEAPGYSNKNKTEDNVYRLPSIKFFWEPNLRLGFPDYFSPLRAAKKWKLDVVHSHTPFTLGSIGHFVAKKVEADLKAFENDKESLMKKAQTKAENKRYQDWYQEMLKKANPIDNRKEFF